MRTAAVLGACAIAAAVVLGFTILGGSAAGAARPSLHVVRSTPLTIQGRHFGARERVRLTAGSKTIRTKANGAGFFIITIRSADRCSSTRVLARGTAGSYAVVKVLPSPACLPARSS